MKRALALLALALVACRSTSSSAVADAFFNTAFALGAAASNRAAGDCYVPCDYGTICNPRTGYCESPPCGGQCQGWEICVADGLGGGECVYMAPEMVLRYRLDAPSGDAVEVPAAAEAAPSPAEREF